MCQSEKEFKAAAKAVFNQHLDTQRDLTDYGRYKAMHDFMTRLGKLIKANAAKRKGEA